LEAQTIPKICRDSFVPKLPQGITSDLLEQGIHIEDLYSRDDEQIDILIGADQIIRNMSTKIIRLTDDLEIRQTKYGWAVLGCSQGKGKNQKASPGTSLLISQCSAKNREDGGTEEKLEKFVHQEPEYGLKIKSGEMGKVKEDNSLESALAVQSVLASDSSIAKNVGCVNLSKFSKYSHFKYKSRTLLNTLDLDFCNGSFLSQELAQSNKFINNWSQQEDSTERSQDYQGQGQELIITKTRTLQPKKQKFRQSSCYVLEPAEVVIEFLRPGGELSRQFGPVKSNLINAFLSIHGQARIVCFDEYFKFVRFKRMQKELKNVNEWIQLENAKKKIKEEVKSVDAVGMETVNIDVSNGAVDCIRSCQLLESWKNQIKNNEECFAGWNKSHVSELRLYECLEFRKRFLFCIGQAVIVIHKPHPKTKWKGFRVLEVDGTRARLKLNLHGGQSFGGFEAHSASAGVSSIACYLYLIYT